MANVTSNLAPANPLANAPSNPANPFASAPSSPAVSVSPPAPWTVTSPPAPTQDVASQVHTDSAGNSVKTTYSPTSTGMLGAQNQNVAAGAGTPGYTYVNGVLTSVGGVPTGSAPAQPANTATQVGSGGANTQASSLAPTANTGQVYNPATGTFVSGAVSTPQSTNNGANAGTSVGNAGFVGIGTPSTTPTSNSTTPTASGLLSTVAAYGQQDPGLTGLYNQQQALTADLANRTGNIINTPTTLNEQTGRLSSLQNEYNSAESNLANTYQANLAQRAQGIGASENALGAATQEVSSPYGQPLVNPATGQTISGGQNITTPTGSSTGGGIQPNDPAYQSLQQYANLVANGSIAATSVPTFGSNPVLLAQLQSMAQQINPNYNPLTTPLNTQTQANTNASIGAGNQTQAAATTQAISRIGNITSDMNNFLTQWGLNATASPYYNSPMNSFLTSGSGAGAVASWKLITSDLQAATSQLMNTPGITPTGFTAELQSFDPTNLSPSELNTYLQALNTAGQYQLNSYQTTASGAYGSNTPANPTAPVQPYVGSQTPATPAPLPQPVNPAAAQAANAPSVGKVVGGAVLNAIGGVERLISGGLGYLASFI